MPSSQASTDPNWSTVLVALLVTLYVLFVGADLLNMGVPPLVGVLLSIIIVFLIYSFRVYLEQ